MRNSVRMLALLTVPLVAVGCWPTERVLWSPDDKQALVITEKGLHFCDVDGNLSPLVDEGVLRACWLPESQGVLGVKQVTLTNWTDVAAALSSERKEAIVNRAREVITVLPRLDGFSARQYLFERLRPSRDIARRFYMTQHHDAELSKAVPEAWEKWRTTEVCMWQIRLYTQTEGLWKPERVLAWSEEEILTLSASPLGTVFAYTTGDWNPREETVGPLDLMVCHRSGVSEPQKVSELVSAFFDWSPDGRSLVFARTTAPQGFGAEGLRLGVVMQRAVCNKDGTQDTTLRTLTAEDDPIILASHPKDINLVGVLFRGDMRIRCSPTGSLFAAREVGLPLGKEDVPDFAGGCVPPISLFTVGSYRTKTNELERLLSSEVGQRAGDLRGFSISPGCRFVSVPDTNGLVSVVALATGKIRAVQPLADESIGRYPVTIPSWRSNSELCFAVPKGSPMGSTNRIEIVLWSPDTGQTRCISKKWPNAAVEGWLFHEEKR